MYASARRQAGTGVCIRFKSPWHHSALTEALIPTPVHMHLHLQTTPPLEHFCVLRFRFRNQPQLGHVTQGRTHAQRGCVRGIMLHVLVALLLLISRAQAYLIDPDGTAGSGHKGSNALWQLQLDPGQCTGNATPCYNIYAIDDSTGSLAWFAFSTDVTAIR